MGLKPNTGASPVNSLNALADWLKSPDLSAGDLIIVANLKKLSNVEANEMGALVLNRAWNFGSMCCSMLFMCLFRGFEARESSLSIIMVTHSEKRRKKERKKDSSSEESRKCVLNHGIHIISATISILNFSAICWLKIKAFSFCRHF